MTVTVCFFASYADRLGTRQSVIELADGATVGDVARYVAALPGGDKLPPDPLIAVNQSYASGEQHLRDGDEVAFIPPVAGG